MKNTVYLSFDKNKIVCERKITVGAVSKVWCVNPHISAKVKAVHITTVPRVKSRRYVYSSIEIVELIERELEDIEINIIGEPEFIISYKEPRNENKLWVGLKILLVSLIVFFGGAYAITAYGNDVDVKGIFKNFGNYVGGNDTSIKIMEICYCIGLTIGIIVFYNHFGSRKKEKDPTPLEIGMKAYEDDINTTIINNSQKEEKENEHC